MRKHTQSLVLTRGEVAEAISQWLGTKHPEVAEAYSASPAQVLRDMSFSQSAASGGGETQELVQIFQKLS